ncbi:MFS transporter [Heyndrickxia ginsengihumi]|uniref:MFS transporter n=1 Tax=Heyndrickxia ginsengihumi TaxID=363870 RepID=A0A0A6Y3B4_9BACI|nr:MFS transporter [Heyndrickxia ginsengihumi]KHD86752.1 MFS transporter [Heyndrickxia ginsengihumi]MBE6183731.1 MFS transporter [Bacillus sp. (in: firmicutes)]NEY18458.1 MFS transporter [Heyndrickxia ginsengihumi]
MGFEQLDSSKLKKFQRKVTLLSAAGTFLDGFDLTIIAVAMPLILEKWDVGPGLQGIITSAAVIGALIGAILLGNLTDKFGRKAMYVVDLLAFVVFAALTACSQSVWQLMLFRFLLGIGIGADYPISATLVSEFSPTKSRGQHSTFLGAAWFVGAVAAYLVGILLIPLGENAWRYMLLLGAIFALIIFCFRVTLPESPRWLAARGREKEAEDIMMKVIGEKASIKPSGKNVQHISYLFSKSFFQRTFFVCGFWFCYSVAYYGISMYTPTILKSFSNGSQISTYIGAGTISVLGLIGALLGFNLVERIGRRPLILISFLGLTGSLVILAINNHPTMLFLVVLFSLAVLFANMGAGILNFVYPTELFPTGIRASASGLATAVSRAGSVMGIFIFPQLVILWGNSKALWFFAVISLIGLMISMVLAPETKGMNLEELSDENQHSNFNETMAGENNETMA